MPAVGAVSQRGIGKLGYCKLCASEIEPELNKRLKADWKVPAIQEWMAKFTKPDGRPMYANRQTIYAHKKHITSPEARVVSYAQRARENPVIKAASNRQFLEAVRDIGFQRANDNPEEITIGDALKAVQIMESTKEKTGDVYFILASVMARSEPLAIEGTAVEV